MKTLSSIATIILIIFLAIGISKRWNRSETINSKQPSPTPIMLRVGYNTSSLKHSPTMVALEKNIFARYGLNVEPVIFKNGNEIQQALATNQLDIGIAGATSFFIPISKGLPMKIIMPLVSSPTTILVRANSDVKTLAQLQNKKIGVEPSVGSDTLVVLQVLREEGIDEKKINFIPIERTLRPIALLKKFEIDATVSNDTDRQSYDPSLATELRGWTDSVYPEKSYMRNVAVVNTIYQEKNPQAVLNYVKAMIETQKYIKENPVDSAQAVVNHLQKTTNTQSMTLEKVTEVFRTMTFMVWDDPQVLQKIADTSFAVGELKKKLSFDELFDARFATLLEPAQKDIYGGTANK